MFETKLIFRKRGMETTFLHDLKYQDYKNFHFHIFNFIKWNPQKSNNQFPGDISSGEFKTLRPFPFFTPGGMEKNLVSNDLTMPNKYNQSDYAFSQKGYSRTHLKMHNGEKSKKCNQCEYASAHAHHLRAHLKIHSGEKSNKCNQCDYASVICSG